MHEWEVCQRTMFVQTVLLRALSIPVTPAQLDIPLSSIAHLANNLATVQTQELQALSAAQGASKAR